MEEAVEKKKGHKIWYIFKILFAILVIVGIYVAINFVKIFNKKTIKVYEVNTGEIVNVDRHKGFIFRDEDVATCKNDGYINFYVGNAERVYRGAFIYTVNDTPAEELSFELNDVDKKTLKQNINVNANSISNYDFTNVYNAKSSIENSINELNIVKQLEKIDIEKEIDAKEKGYAKYAGLVSFIIDGLEDVKIDAFENNLIKNYDNLKVSNQKKEVKANDKIYKIIKNPEFDIAFDSDYDYDNYTKGNTVTVKFISNNVNTKGHIESFYGNDGNKHFKLKILEYPEKFLNNRLVEFEIENKKISGYKVPLKSIVSKNCYVVPKGMVEVDPETNENVFYKVAAEGEKVRFTCNISKEDSNYYYISIDDTLSKLKFGDVLTNRYGDNYSLSEVKKLDGVYNMNKGYAVFKNVDIIDKTNEYAIVKKQTVNGVSLYDHIALDASDVEEGDLLS